jgi:hypothetical protein
MGNDTPTVAEALAILREALAVQSPGFVLSTITVQGEFRLSLDVPLSVRPAASAPPPDHRPTSPVEKSILQALGGKGWMTGQEIADAVGFSKSTYFTAVLTNLGEAGVLEASTKNGYRLAPPVEQPSRG